jgi:hypothetical protein
MANFELQYGEYNYDRKDPNYGSRGQKQAKKGHIYGRK